MSLAENIYRMTNEELNGLAKNRFIDCETQKRLAVHPYLRCRQYLAENTSLCEDARVLLYEGKAHSVKLNLCMSGNLNDNPELISEVYENLPERMRCGWRLLNCFVESYWAQGAVNTPAETLENIYLNHFNAPQGTTGYSYYNRYAERILAHKNCSEKLAVMATTSPCENVRIRAVKKISEIRKKTSS